MQTFHCLQVFPGDSVGSRDYPGPGYDGYLLIQRQRLNVSVRAADCCLDQPSSGYCADHKAGFRRHSGLTHLNASPVRGRFHHNTGAKPWCRYAQLSNSCFQTGTMA